MIAYIPLNDSEFAVVDLDDVPALLVFTWCKSGNKYAHTRIPNSGKPGKRMLMHRMLCSGDLIDHINGDKLDNRRSNLRPTTKQLNAFNVQKQRGIRPYKNGRWIVGIYLDGKSKHIGIYNTYDEAVAARKAAQPKETAYVKV